MTAVDERNEKCSVHDDRVRPCKPAGPYTHMTWEFVSSSNRTHFIILSRTAARVVRMEFRRIEALLRIVKSSCGCGSSKSAQGFCSLFAESSGPS